MILVRYTKVASGEVQGSVSASQLPDVPCAKVKLKALKSNVGNVYLGAAGVTKPDGTTDATSGYELVPGEAVELEIANLNVLFRICDNAGDDLVYIAYQ